MGFDSQQIFTAPQRPDLHWAPRQMVRGVNPVHIYRAQIKNVWLSVISIHVVVLKY
jgi:hypothetical protein